jgi:4-alpha-glucanotransferase
VNQTLNKRRAGVLLHITSLPGSGITGDLGADAYHFVDFLHNAGMTIWQTLPLGMTHSDGSPYQCLSAHAGDPKLININELTNKGWLNVSENCIIECEGPPQFNKSCLVSKAYSGFLESAVQKDREDYARFCDESAFWLDDFSLFLAIRNEFNQQCWNQWPDGLKEREANVIKEARQRLKL